MFNCSQTAPTCISPSESIKTTWRRVGSLTCFRTIAAFCACLSRRSAPFFALIALAVVLAAPLVNVAIEATPDSCPRRDGTTPHRSPGSFLRKHHARKKAGPGGPDRPQGGRQRVLGYGNPT